MTVNLIGCEINDQVCCSVSLNTDHVNHFGVDGFCDDVPVVGDVLHHLA